MPLSARNRCAGLSDAAARRRSRGHRASDRKLWASSDAPDTDFTAKLIDVYPPNKDYPGGVDLNIADSIVRARYRKEPRQGRVC